MRQPHQILAFPYKKDDKGNYLYGIFKRSDKEQWQGVAGGVEEGETYLEACKREVKEETGLDNVKIVELESISTMPVVNVTGKFTWGDDVFLVYEHCYGVEISDQEIKLSHEHKTMEWLPYEEAFDKLTWDSNKNALWELNQKLINDKAKQL